HPPPPPRAEDGSPDISVCLRRAPPAARFPGVTVYLAEPRMGRSRRAFLTRLALSKGFCVLDAYRCAVMAKGPSAEEAVCRQERRTAALHPGCTRPVLLDVSWFTESTAAGQPVPVECRHRLEELLQHGVCEEVERVRLSERYQAMKRGSGTRVPPSCSSSPGPALLFQKSRGRGSEWLA
uniref:DNA polymerase mu n=1 Tax=Balaenoptera musculus TaxID=9771 RepID=A0A8C0CVR6_BALMU